MPVLGGRVFPALMIAAFASQAAAQAKACDLDESTPSQVTRAVLDLQLAGSAGKPEDAAKKLQEAVKFLNEGDMKKNPVGRASVYGKVMVTWLMQPGMSSGTTTRGAVGFATEPTAPFDIIGAIDSAFTIVETANPECATQTAAWRQQKPWVDLINHAMELGNSGSDSAVAVAKRSLQLARSAPYGYLVLAQASAKAEKPKEALAFYKQALAVATDTSLADTRRQIYSTVGNYAADLIESSTGEDKKAYMAEAKAAFDALAKDPGTKYADAARMGQAKLATLSGDTTAIRASYADQMANPGAFSYASLMTAAVTAARANQTKDAIKLFEAAYAVNPQHRDVLYNLTRLYIVDSAYRKSLPLAQKLVTVDPSNPDNFQLLAIAYSQIKRDYDVKVKGYEAKAKELGQRANTAKSAAVQKAAIDSAARLTPLIKAYSDSAKISVDSAIKYNTITLPVKVEFTEFTPTDAKTSLAGRVTNQSDAAKTLTLKIQFVDKAGNVVSTQDVPVGPIAPKASATFTAAGTGAGIVAFRYGPIS
jgi:tetratricopeptide (TPR) repeat protein